MVFLAFSVHYLFFEGLRQLHTHPLLGKGTCLLHQHHGVNQDCFVKKLVATHWLTFVDKACHLLYRLVTALSSVLVKHGRIKCIQGSNSVYRIRPERILANLYYFLTGLAQQISSLRRLRSDVKRFNQVLGVFCG